MTNNWKEIYDRCVYKYHVRDTSFYVLCDGELPNTGFRSLYSFTAETAAALEEAPTFAGYKGAVWSEALAIDLDSDEAAVEAEQRLGALGLAYEVWSTGNRGCHIMIPRPTSPSHFLPLMDREWVKNNFNKVDLSIYTHLNMFRLPGTRHEETGKKKVLIKKVEGQPLRLEGATYELTKKRIEFLDEVGKTGNNSTSIFLDSYIMSMTVPHENGTRHNAIRDLGLALNRRGCPPSVIEYWLRQTMLLFSEPLDEVEFRNLVQFSLGGTTHEGV